VVRRVHWVFAYGSLMFRPGFDVAEVRPGWLRHRRRVFGHPSVRNWGTRVCPAPTASLVAGAGTWGLVVRPGGDAVEVFGRLVEREASEPEVGDVEVDGDVVAAYVWTMGSEWAGRGIEELVEAAVANVSCGGGPYGNAWDYADGVATVLDRHGLVDPLVVSYHAALAAALGGGR